VQPFGGDLDKLSGLVVAGADVQQVRAAYEVVMRDLTTAEAAVHKLTPADRFKVVAGLVRTAAEEYKEGVENGKVTEAVEYQDAYGFTQVASQMLDGLSPADRERYASAYKSAREQIDGLKPAWPAIVPPEHVEMDASTLAGAAARIELAAPRG
jgi:hypothetical protein